MNGDSREALKLSLFHEPWWLSAVTNGRYQEAVVNQGTRVVGRLPYLTSRRGPFHISRMPPFTHLLGPVVDAGSGKPQTRLVRRLSIVRSLIDQLPPVAFFQQHFDPSIDCGLAAVDGLAFQDRGFTVAPQYTFKIDCRNNSEGEIWNAMHFKTRQHIRRAEEKYSIRNVDEPTYFIKFYLRNIRALGKVNRTEFEYFAGLFSECCSRNCGEILAAFNSDGSPMAMVFLVWSRESMYYLLSTRVPNMGDNGSVNFLLWHAIKRARQLAIVLDLDGVYSSGTARFLSGFGGQIDMRLVVRRSRFPYRALQYMKWQYSNDEVQYFT